MRDHLLQLGSSLDLDMTRADGVNVLQYRERGFYGCLGTAGLEQWLHGVCA